MCSFSRSRAGCAHHLAHDSPTDASALCAPRTGLMNRHESGLIGNASHLYHRGRSQGYRRGNRSGSIPQEVDVSASVLYMSVSLDGYIAGPNDEPRNPGGDGFDRLHEWILTPDRKF